MEEIIKTAKEIEYKLDTFSIRNPEDINILVQLLKEAQEFLRSLKKI